MEPNNIVTETPEPTSVNTKLKTFAKKYWKPVAAGAAITAAAVVAIARYRDSETEELEAADHFTDEEIQASIDYLNENHTPKQ